MNAGTDRQYVVFSRAWYSKAQGAQAQRGDIVDDVVLSGGLQGGELEIIIGFNQKVADEDGKPVAVIEVFRDSWAAFKTWQDLFQALAEKKPVDLASLEAVLQERGFRDATETVEP